MSMFCFQCQETAMNKGCTLKGVCGKTADVANLQDLLIFLLKGISRNTVRLREAGKEYPEANRFVMESLFMTITNANFDKERFVKHIREAIALPALCQIGCKLECILSAHCFYQAVLNRGKNKTGYSRISKHFIFYIQDVAFKSSYLA